MNLTLQKSWLYLKKKKNIRNRVKNTKPEDFENWDEFIDSFKL